VIRFSAGLVVVAIGVLIGGVTTSKLSLVYIAIAVSAVALVVLAIGVALKRDELFGGGSEAVPASAGTDSEVPVGQLADAGHVRGSNGHGRADQPKIRPTGPATAAFEAAEAAAAKAAAAEAASKAAAPPTVAAPSVTIPPVTAPAEQRQHAYSQASTRVDETVADWDTRPPQAPWSPGDQGRQSWAPREQAPREQAPSSGWGSSADQSAPPSWFDRLNQPVVEPATAAPAKAEAAPATAKTPSAETEPPKAGPFAAFAAAKTSTPDADSPAAAPSPAAADVDTDDDDWPTRYSWLEDGDADDVDTQDGARDGAGQPDAAAPAEVTSAAETVAASTLSPDTVPAKTVAVDEPIVTADSIAELAETPAVTAAHEDEAAGPEEPPAPQNADAKLVTVIPGVPRYHDPDCILIRFMDEGDIARKSIPEAQAANCTPCAACQPEG
jgi:hypothetical protein